MAVSLILLALAEAMATASFITTPRHLAKNSRFRGPLRLHIERAANVGGATIYGADFLGPANVLRQDFLGDGVLTNYDSALTYAAFSNYNWLVKVSKSTRTGTVTVTAASATVTGSSTDFLPELQVGDEIMVNGETRTVIDIASDTVLTVDTPFVSAAAAVAIYLVDAVLRHTTDYTVASNGGLARITLTAAAKAPAGSKVEVHNVTPVAKYTFATATTEFKQLEIVGADLMWYVSDATATPSATNCYVAAIGQ